MALRWPLLLLLVVIALAAAAYVAFRRTRHGWQGELPLLARSHRLTELPEYQRAIRLHERLAVVALVSSIVAVAALIGATVRPAWTYEPSRAAGDTPYVDVMLCFGDDFSMLSSRQFGLVPLLTDVQDKVNHFGNQRIGMTHAFYRNFPVTADHQWVSGRLDEIIGLAGESESAGSKSYVLDKDVYERSAYSAGVQPKPVDTLAMCTMGLPSVGQDNGRARMIVYFGRIEDFEDPGAIIRYDKPPQRVYPKATLEKAVKSARIQINAVVPDAPDNKPIGFVERLVEDTGGKAIQYTDLGYLDKGSQRHADNLKEELANAVDEIMANPPPSALDEARAKAMRPFQWDLPDLLLQIALVAAVAVGAARLGMRL